VRGHDAVPERRGVAVSGQPVKQQGGVVLKGRKSLCCVAGIVVALALSSGCEKGDLSDNDVRSICMNLGAGGWQSAMAVARDAGLADDAKAAAAVRKAAHDTCPAYTDKLR
jgi:hypothetical protein